MKMGRAPCPCRPPLGTRIATAPALTRTHEGANPGHGSPEHRSADNPAIRAPASYRVVALAGPAAAIRRARYSVDRACVTSGDRHTASGTGAQPARARRLDSPAYRALTAGW